MKVLLATPAHSGVKVEYAMSLAKLMDTCARTRPQTVIETSFLSLSVIHRARNLLATLALSKDYTHLLFVDSDMGFEPSAIFRLLDSGHDVCGCLCPKRTLDLKRFHALSRTIDDPEQARRAALDYASQQLLRREIVDGQSVYVARKGFIETIGIGMGVTVIATAALRRMMEALPQLGISPANTAYATFGFDPIYRFFDPMPVEGHDILDEDLAFCERWRKACDGKIFALVDEEIAHVGEWAFSGKATERLKAGL